MQSFLRSLFISLRVDNIANRKITFFDLFIGKVKDIEVSDFDRTKELLILELKF